MPDEALLVRIRELEAELAEARAAKGVLDAVLTALPAFILETDDTFRIRGMNHTQPGFRAEDVRGTSMFDYMPANERERSRAIYERVMSTGQAEHYTTSGAGADGREAHYSSYAARVRGANGAFGLMVVAIDVTTQMARDAAFRENAEQLRAAQAATGMGLWVSDLVTGVTTWDEAMFAICGTNTELSPQQYLEHVHPEDRAAVEANRRETLERGSFRPVANRFVRPDGDVRSLVTVGRVLSDESGRLTKLIGGTLDVTEHRRAEDRVRQMQRLESVGELAAGIAHNFNNMLAVMLPALSYVRRVVPPTHVRVVDDAEQAGRRAAEMVSQLVTFAGRRRRPERRREHGSNLVGETLRVCERLFERHVALHVDDRAGDVTLVCHAADIEQVLMNILINARDAVRNRPRPEIRVELDVVERAPVAQEGAFLRVRVSDNGAGMTESVRVRIFEPFFTTKGAGAGTGLGLATAYAIVSEHGGALHCESAPDEGTVFEVYLPLHERGEPSVGTATEPPTSEGHGEWILVVDDEAAVARVTACTLEASGYRVQTVDSGHAAIEEARRNPDIRLVLLDRALREGQGDEWIAPLRAVLPRARIVFFTGQEVTEPDLHLVDGVVTKPPAQGALERCAEEQLRREA